MSSKIGFIGLGSQGGPIARRMIDAGLPVMLWARRAEALRPYRETPAEYAETPAQLAAQCKYIGLCVVNDRDVNEVCDQVIPAMLPGGCLVIHSTIHPETCRSLAAKAEARGLQFIDAPVSGGAPAAESGTLTVMIGGKTEAVEAARPVLQTFGKLIVHLGDVGAGQHAKLINNTLLAANLAVAHFALTAGKEVGIDRSALVALLLASSGRSFAVEVCARMPEPKSFAHGAALLAKDVGLLGSVMGSGHAAFVHLQRSAQPFLDSALQAAAS